MRSQPTPSSALNQFHPARVMRYGLRSLVYTRTYPSLRKAGRVWTAALPAERGVPPCQAIFATRESLPRPISPLLQCGLNCHGATVRIHASLGRRMCKELDLLRPIPTHLVSVRTRHPPVSNALSSGVATISSGITSSYIPTGTMARGLPLVFVFMAK